MENHNAEQKAQYHAWFQHRKADGYITMAKKTATGFRQYHYKPEALAVKLSQWLGEDVYFSQNTFYKPERQIEHIRQLRALYVDVDQYLLNYDPDWTIGKLETEIFQEHLPDPNLIIYSGRGFVLVWLIGPVPYRALPLWQAMQDHFLEQLQYVGGDSRATDAARVFRIAGSVNSKNGAEVNVQYRHDFRYALRDLQYDYLPALQPKKKTKRGRPKKVEQLYNTYSLHHARLLDLVKLVECRDDDIKGYRETMCFLYRYWLCCYLTDPDEALRQTLVFNARFNAPLPEHEVTRATKSAEKAWAAKNNKEANDIAREKGYPGAGYNISNKKLIEWLAITEAEQVQLSTIIGTQEKYRRKNEKRYKRRRHEYLEQERDKTEDKLFLLQKAMERYPDATNIKLAELLAVTEGYIRKLKQKI